jgi:competence protein ComFC
MSRLRSIAKFAAESTWVEMCSECGRRGNWVCEYCRPNVSALPIPQCQRCGAQSLALCECQELPDAVTSIRAAYPFVGWVRSSIHQFKFSGEFARAGHLAAAMIPVIDRANVDLLIPVPMHPDRERIRGFNQSTLLARHISSATGIAMSDIALHRPIKRAPQVGRDRHQRWHAIKGVFQVADPALIKSRKILIVDDVITTGATVSECAQELMAAGADSAHAVAIARG